MIMADETTPLFVPTLLPWDPTRRKWAAIVMLSSLTLERLAFYALVTNLYVFLSLGGISAEDCLTAVLVLNGVAYFFALGGGWLADGVIGRYWTLVLGLILYVCGYTMLSLIAAGILWSNTPSHLPHLYVTLIIIGIAAGTVRANFPSFGAEQVRHGGPEALTQFFNWYYWCVNTGSLLGVGVLSLVAQDSVGHIGGFTGAWGGAGVGLCLALILFTCGRPLYIVHRPSGSPLLGTLSIIKQGMVGRCGCCRSANIQWSPLLPRRSDQAYPRLRGSSWLDYAKTQFGGTYADEAVEDVKALGIVLLLLITLLPYWLVFFQIETGFQDQGVHLKIGLAENGTTVNFSMPTSWLTLFDQLFILALIPLLNGLVYPALDRRGVRVSLLTRVAIGMAFSSIAAICAGVLEIISLRRWNAGFNITQVIHDTTYEASDVSVLWQIPQYCLVGTAEVFAGVAGLEFAYSAAPRSMQAVAMGLLAAMEGIGSLLGSLLVAMLSPVWIRKDHQHFEGHLDYYFFLLSGIQGITLILFTIWLVVQHRRGARVLELQGLPQPCYSHQSSYTSSLDSTGSSSINTCVSE